LGKKSPTESGVPEAAVSFPVRPSGGAEKRNLSFLKTRAEKARYDYLFICIYISFYFLFVFIFLFIFAKFCRIVLHASVQFFLLFPLI